MVPILINYYLIIMLVLMDEVTDYYYLGYNSSTVDNLPPSA